MANLPTQDDAVANGKADAALVGTGGTTGPGARIVKVESPVSGTAFQPALGYPCDLYINIKTAAALAVAIGPNSSASTVLSASQSSALGLMHIEVPGGFYVKLTGTMANLDVTSIRK